MTVLVQLNLKPLEQALRTIGREATTKAASIAINKAVQGVAMVPRREIPKRASYTFGQVKARTREIKASPGSLRGIVSVKGRWEAASFPQFKLRPSVRTSTRSSPVPSFAPWKKRETREGGFVATMRSGHRSIFARTGKGRLPIEDIGWGPNIAREMEREDHGYDIPQQIYRVAQDRFNREFERQYWRVVGAAKARFGL